MIKFLFKTIVVSAAAVSIPIMIVKELKKLNDEGFFN